MASMCTTVCQNTLKTLSFDILDDVSSTSSSPSSSESSVEFTGSQSTSDGSSESSVELLGTQLTSGRSSESLQTLAELSSSLQHLGESSFSWQTSPSSDQSSLDTNSPTPAAVSGSLDVPKHKSSPLKFPPCVICGGKASGLHYGCNTCEACKNFFRRYLVRKKSYVCPKQRECQISFTNKGNCSGCRLTKCLDLGMSKTKSKLGRYSYNKRTEAIKQMKQLEGKNCNVSVLGPSISTTSSGNLKKQQIDNTISNDITNKDAIVREDEAFDDSYIEMLTKAVEDIHVYEDEELKKEGVIEAKCKAHYEKYLLKVSLFGSMNAISKEEYQVLLRDYGIDIDNIYSACLNIRDSWKGIIDRYCDFAKALPGFSELSKNDQTNLLKSTNMHSFSVLYHKSYSSKYQVFIETDGSAYHVEECADRFFTREITLEYIKIFEFLQKLDLSKEEEALMIALCTFSTDCCRLEDYDTVEKLQIKYFNLLSSYLHSNYDRATAVRRLSKIMDCLIKMRDMANKYYVEMNQLKNDKLFSDVFPYLEELTPSEDW